MADSPKYDALLVVSFGGPDGPEDVLPFLENVLRGRNVPRERMLEVAEHYYHFGGGSPINEQNRRLIAAIERELAEHGPQLPVYWGNRNWHPLLPDTLRQMAADGVKRALAFVTSGFSSYSGCRQYRENIAAAQAEVGSAAPVVDKLRVFFNHPGFIEPMIELTRSALEQVPAERRSNAILFSRRTASRSSMAQGCRYEEQLREACRLVAEGVDNSLSLGRGRGEGALATSLPKPQRPTASALAGTRHQRLYQAAVMQRSPLTDSSSSPLVSFPIIWKCCTIWTPKCGNCASAWESTWFAPPRSAPIRGLCG